MHIPEGVLSPGVAAATAALGAAGLGLALSRMRRDAHEGDAIRMGIMAAFVFAAQMVNFPVGPGVSGHLLGGMLAALVLGPWRGAVVIATVLIVQCLLFADGGLTALGANFVNLGLIGSVGAYAIYEPLRRALPGPRGVLLGAMAGAWFSVILAAASFTLQLAASGWARSLIPIMGWMVLVHAGIGLAEALITGLVARFLLVTRPDFIEDPLTRTESRPRRRVRDALGGLAVAAAVVVFLAPLASSLPDGLEYVGQKLHFLPEDAPPVLPAPIADYAVPGLGSFTSVATVAAGLLGSLVVFGVALVLAQVLQGGATAVPGAQPAPPTPQEVREARDA